jgi:hypothetical protein
MRHTSRVFDWQLFGDDVRQHGPLLLAAGVVPGPPEGPFVEGRAYPLGVDVDGSTGAVSYAALNPYPDIAPGWWCVAIRFTQVDGVWRDGDQDDNSTTQQPFVRPIEIENSTSTWFDWHSNGGLGDYSERIGDPPRYRHMFLGIAPARTARLTVTDETTRERDLSITPWRGAYVANVEGAFSRLTGYDRNGQQLGSFVCSDGLTSEPDLEPPPGWERVEGLGDGASEPIVHRQSSLPADH